MVKRKKRIRKAVEKNPEDKTLAMEKNVLTYTPPKEGTGVVNSDNIITADK